MTKALVASVGVASVAALCIAIAVLALGPAAFGQAQTGGIAPTGKAGKPLPAAKAPPAPQAQPAAASPALRVPPPEVLLVLIRTTLVALNQAVYTGNFTVLRDLGCPIFQQANSPAQLGVIFADLRNRNIDLYPVAVVTPEVSEPPTITPQNMLRLVGFFPTQPLQIKFQMLFQPVNGQWRLFGMSVDTAPSAMAPVAAAQGTAPATNASPPATPALRPATTLKPTASAKKDTLP